MPATRQRVVVNIYVYVYCIHFSKFYAICLFCLFVRVLGRVDSEVNLRPLRNLCILFVIYFFSNTYIISRCVHTNVGTYMKYIRNSIRCSTSKWFRAGTVAGVPFSISQPGEDAVPPDTAERRHTLPLQACPDRLTLKGTPARPGCGTS